jgi:hypothetical protein
MHLEERIIPRPGAVRPQQKIPITSSHFSPSSRSPSRILYPTISRMSLWAGNALN